MPARSKQKWLTIESLRSGLFEHVAVVRDGRTHAAILDFHNSNIRGGDTFVVRREVRDADGRMWENHVWWFTSLDDAREHWKTQAYQIQG